MDEVEEKNVKLRCGVYGDGSVFSVEVERNGDVEALQEKNGAWLKSDPFKPFLKHGRKEDSAYVVEMIPNWDL
ncbi:hypothetical protein PPTG_24097 [Phytophthora nicotianae INRA-310]|uniref:Uncharacterized protein n=2 Tax=Phytophthora nicotianae TaxID=4792 RepID=W2PJY5_PHYN3|nr:hypothetical protein PPTG_24097 [Phytophthora nicotianae INRA-310]ETI34917.1 hypothetical protein F443_18670 [Phytophthora nicotianae P1569]ETN01303.1 hypothetical protein PPTG_24097 [Phytophthora nicotianae INRA-310]